MGDPVEAVARVAVSRRDHLLRVNRRRLRWEDLEDCYSQAALELVARAQRDPFDSPEHILNALEQKFSSRIDDRRRAIGGRSPIETAIARALPVDAPEMGAGDLEDRNAEVVRQVAARMTVRRLREVAAELTEDQRLVLACQVGLEMDCAEFCRRFGWSSEKFRKVAQRGRKRLRALEAEYDLGERCRRLEPDLAAYSASAATAVQAERATAHLANCTACASQMRALDRVSRQVAVLLPGPLAAKAGLLAKLGIAVMGARRVFASVGRGTTEAGAAGVAGGSVVGAGAVKLGVAAACLASAAGGIAICAHAGLGGSPAGRIHHHAHLRGQHGVVGTASVTELANVRGAPIRLPQQRQAASPAPARPVTGAAASAVARREFSSVAAHAAATLPSGSQPIAQTAQPGTGTRTGTGQFAPVRAGAAAQAQREFSGFER